MIENCESCRLLLRRDAGEAPLWDNIQRTPHVHFHIIPRHADLPASRRSPGIFADHGTDEEKWVSEEAMNEIAVRLQAALAK